jgi:hypothetical protein
MRKLFLIFILALFALPAAAQDSSVVITWPPPVYDVTGTVEVVGTVNPADLQSYFLEVGAYDQQSPQWIPVTLPKTAPVVNGVIDQWLTSLVSDGVYQLRLHVKLRSGQDVYSVVGPIRVANALERPEGEAVIQPLAPVQAVEPTAEPALSPVEDTRFQVGIQVQQALDFNPDIQDSWMREVQKLGLNWIKQQVRWEDFQPTPGEIDWRILDLVMPSAQHFGHRVMLSIVTAPDWAREPGVNLNRHGPPANNSDYVNFVTAILERYPGQVHAIEVWNEQNLDREWTSIRGLSARNYVSLLSDTYNAVKAIDPGIIIISGALSPTGLNDGIGAYDDYFYLEQMLAAGVLDVADCIGAHANGYNIGPNVPWNQVPNDPSARFRGPFANPHHSWSFYSTINGYADRVRGAGGDQKICVTEFGWASTEDLDGYPPGFEFANDNTLEEQRDFTIQALNLMQEWGNVWLAFIWNLNYGPQAGWDTNNDNVPYSIIGKDYAFRPVYDAIIQWSSEQAAG